ncbi:MAG TPA: hypothetical protein VEC37_03520 [Bacillota bacterium]|nr:hypothetical protein [Bacillota bacterium]
MSILGNLGYLYMWILLLLLIAGLGSFGYWALNYIAEYFNLKLEQGWFTTDWVKVCLLSLTALLLLFTLEQFFHPRSFVNNSMQPTVPNPYLVQPQEPLPLFQATPADRGQAHSQHH